ncbi:MAG: c-type cytochrome [Oligoflexus sp.]
MRYAIVFFLAFTSCVSGPSREEITTLKAEPGYQVYLDAGCAKCHGKYGQGIFGNQALKGKALTVETVQTQVREGSAQGMPKYEKTTKENSGEDYFYISDQDLNVLAQFLEKNWGQTATASTK